MANAAFLKRMIKSNNDNNQNQNSDKVTQQKEQNIKEIPLNENLKNENNNPYNSNNFENNEFENNKDDLNYKINQDEINKALDLMDQNEDDEENINDNFGLNNKIDEFNIPNFNENDDNIDSNDGNNNIEDNFTVEEVKPQKAPEEHTEKRRRGRPKTIVESTDNNTENNGDENVNCDATDNESDKTIKSQNVSKNYCHHITEPQETQNEYLERIGYNNNNNNDNDIKNKVAEDVLQYVCIKTIKDLSKNYTSKMYTAEFTSSLFNDYLKGKLTDSKKILFKELLAECIKNKITDSYLEDLDGLTEAVLNYIIEME